MANILLNNNGEVKIADFGLARALVTTNPNFMYTNKVVTLWYRAPELLLGMRKYTSQIDMWSIGCILLEFLTGENFLKGDSDYRQMEKIYELCGNPNEQNWPDVTKLENWNEFMPRKLNPRKLSEIMIFNNPTLDNHSIDLVE